MFQPAGSCLHGERDDANKQLHRVSEPYGVRRLRQYPHTATWNRLEKLAERHHISPKIRSNNIAEITMFQLNSVEMGTIDSLLPLLNISVFLLKFWSYNFILHPALADQRKI